MSMGRNTPSAAKLRGFVEEIERINAQIKDLQGARTAIFAAAKSDGFVAGAIRYVIKARAMKPHDRADAETTRDLYMHAMGMDAEPPLFRLLKAVQDDALASDNLLETFKQLVPSGGEIIATIGGKKMRLWRDKDGEVHTEEWKANAPADAPDSRRTLPPAAKKDVPECTEDEAEELGRQAAKDNKPVIDNPFPFDDARRPRWDLGWRKETGNDGMEPGDD